MASEYMSQAICYYYPLGQAARRPAGPPIFHFVRARSSPPEVGPLGHAKQWHERQRGAPGRLAVWPGRAQRASCGTQVRFALTWQAEYIKVTRASIIILYSTRSFECIRSERTILAPPRLKQRTLCTAARRAGAHTARFLSLHTSGHILKHSYEICRDLMASNWFVAGAKLV